MASYPPKPPPTCLAGERNKFHIMFLCVCLTSLLVYCPFTAFSMNYSMGKKLCVFLDVHKCFGLCFILDSLLQTEV